MRQYFNPRSPMEILQYPTIFQSTPPHGERPCQSAYTGHPAYHFNPRSRMGSDPACPWSIVVLREFQSTPPAWGATRLDRVLHRQRYHFNPRSPHGEADEVQDELDDLVRIISIHAPRMGSDVTSTQKLTGDKYISIHAPRMGSDGMNLTIARALSISIHAPRMGSDNGFGAIGVPPRIFQSTLPAWGTTFWCSTEEYEYLISIHAPRMGSDADIRGPDKPAGHISIHAPRMGSDQDFRKIHQQMHHFNPRSPHGERPCAFGRTGDS